MSEVFGAAAEELLSHGLAVLPVDIDKKPLVSGFDGWHKRPGLSTVRTWATKFPYANIAVIPGISGIDVADVDCADQVREVEELLGWTPLKVKSSRGAHLYYKRTREQLPNDLKKWGLLVDLKAGNSIVVAPPSRHRSGIIYELMDCTWSSLKGLPEINTVTLKQFIESKVSSVPRADMRQQSRGLWLNDRLCKGAAYCDDFDGLVDLAQTLNLEIEARGLEPLPEGEITSRAAAVWKDVQEGKIQKWLGTSGVARSSEGEALMLCEIDHRHAGDAYMLLCVLRLKHSVRCRRGETFNFNPKAMALAGVLPGWSRERYEKARHLLLEARLLLCVASYHHTADGRVGAQYRLGSTITANPCDFVAA